jgi:hypothetical protein
MIGKLIKNKNPVSLCAEYLSDISDVTIIKKIRKNI